MIATSLVLLVVAIAGAPWVQLLDPDAPRLRFAGESFLLGSGICASVLMILGLAGIRWQTWVIVLCVGALTFCGDLLLFAYSRTSRRIAPRTRSLPAMVLDTATVVTLFGYAKFATAAPMWELDFLDNWGLKGRVFWHARGFDWSFLTNPSYPWSHQDYPPLIPLMFDLIAFGNGAWEDRWIGLYYVATAAALLAILRSVLSEEIGNLAASAGTLAMVCLVVSPWPGLADGPLVAYGTAGILHLRRAVDQERKSLLLLASMLLGFAALTKNEGVTLVLAAAVAVAVTAGAGKALRLWPAAVLFLPWMLARARFDLATDLTTGSFLDRALDRLRQPATILAELARYVPMQPLLWLGIALGLVAGFRYLRRERLVLIVVGIQILFYLGAYLITPLDLAFHIRWSLNRLLWHVLPLLAFVSLLTVARAARRDDVLQH